MAFNKLVSFCLFAYNHEAFIKEAVESALRQTYSPLEIIISDDCSTDATFQIITEITELYKGPHKIILNRNQHNIGLGGHFSHVCSNLSSGDYLVVLGGDDISFDEHVQKAVEFIENNPEALMVDFNGQVIDSNGKEMGIYQDLQFDEKRYFLTDYLKFRPIYSFAPGRIFKRALISEFDPISINCPTEDTVIILRSLLLGGFMRANKSLVFYRQHENSLSSTENRWISNLSIVSQYYLDIFKIFNEKRIDEAKCDRLLQRINLEYKIRKARYNKKRNESSFLINRVYLRLLKIYYSSSFSN